MLLLLSLKVLLLLLRVRVGIGADVVHGAGDRVPPPGPAEESVGGMGWGGNGP